MRTHSPNFKVTVVEDLIQNHLSYGEVSRKYDVTRSVIRRWERIYLEEGPEGLSIERRGRTKQTETESLRGRPMSLGAKGEEDLIAELQRLRMENAYLKKLNALVQAKEKFSK
jgi:transposase